MVLNKIGMRYFATFGDLPEQQISQAQYEYLQTRDCLRPNEHFDGDMSDFKNAYATPEFDSVDGGYSAGDTLISDGVSFVATADGWVEVGE